MEGCSAPLVVKFADTQKEKDAKRMQTIHSNLWNFAGINNPMTAASPISLTSPAVHHPSTPSLNSSPFLASDAMPSATASLQLLQQLQAIGLQQQLLQGKIKFFKFLNFFNIFFYY